MAGVKEQGSAPMQVNAEEGQLISCSLCRRVLTAETDVMDDDARAASIHDQDTCTAMFILRVTDCVHLP